MQPFSGAGVQKELRGGAHLSTKPGMHDMLLHHCALGINIFCGNIDCIEYLSFGFSDIWFR